MNPTLKNILAVVLGWIAGSFVNMGLVTAGHKLMPIEGVDPSDMEAFAEALPTLEPKYFLFPFLAHALGTLVGAAIAGMMATGNKMKFALAVGFLFLIGGVIVNIMLPGPIWFSAVDIVLAYIPMAVIGGKIALKLSKKG